MIRSEITFNYTCTLHQFWKCGAWYIKKYISNKILIILHQQLLWYGQNFVFRNILSESQGLTSYPFVRCNVHVFIFIVTFFQYRGIIRNGWRRSMKFSVRESPVKHKKNQKLSWKQKPYVITGTTIWTITLYVMHQTRGRVFCTISKHCEMGWKMRHSSLFLTNSKVFRDKTFT